MARVRARHLLPVMAATAAVAFSLAGAGADTSSSSVQLASYQRIATAVPAAGPYLAHMKQISGEIASRIGHPLSLSLGVVLNATNIKVDGAPVAAYADAYDSTGDQVGPASRCVIHLNPVLYKEKNTGDFNSTLAHEVFHCFEAMDYPTLPAFGTAPGWLIEGEAEWVGATLYPAEDSFWDAYLTDPSISLFARKYSAIGFYSLMTASGQDTWHLLDPMLKAPSSAAAYALAANSTLKLDWASSLARKPDFGKGWDATGPGITDSRYKPTVSVLRQGTVLKGDVAPYTNALIAFDPSADVVDITAGTPYSRLHEADGTGINGLSSSTSYCVKDCDKCPEMKDMPKLEPGATWLAVTGDTAGSSYVVTGAPPMCSCIRGTWKVTSESGPSTSGGAGVVWMVSPKGTIAVDYDGSAPFIGPGGFSYTYRGSADYKTTLPPNPTGSSGSYVATPVSQHVTATYSIPGKGQITTSEPLTAHATTWTCSGNSLSLHISVTGGIFSYALTRTGT
ncbi:MAG TPA: hypothetical protein VND70_03395 [Acidimicrobiales bacterium]|nr:hypothetical protein [Acidimicrobiales bacterium]